MRVLSLDIGDVVIGVAICDPLEIIAQPLTALRRVSAGEDAGNIVSLVGQYEVKKLVVGLPKTMSGEIGIQAQKVLNFVEILKSVVDIPVVLWDERLTTVEAERTLISANIRRKKRKQVLDKMAAVLILQGYLDSRGSRLDR